MMAMMMIMVVMVKQKWMRHPMCILGLHQTIRSKATAIDTPDPPMPLSLGVCRCSATAASRNASDSPGNPWRTWEPRRGTDREQRTGHRPTQEGTGPKGPRENPRRGTGRERAGHGQEESQRTLGAPKGQPREEGETEES